MHPAQQRLLLVGERKCISNLPFNHILSTQIGQLHVVAVDQLRCLTALNLVQRPIGNQAVAEGREHARQTLRMQLGCFVVTQRPIPDGHVINQTRHPVRRRRTQYPTDRRVVHPEFSIRLGRNLQVIQFPVHVHPALAPFLHKHHVMPLPIIRFCGGVNVVDPRPTTLADVKIDRTTGPIVGGPDVE